MSAPICDPLVDANAVDSVVGPFSAYLYKVRAILDSPIFSKFQEVGSYPVDCSNPNEVNAKFMCVWNGGSKATYEVEKKCEKSKFFQK